MKGYRNSLDSPNTPNDSREISPPGEFDYRYHNKVHYPNCGCIYNRKNLYLVDILDKITKKYRHITYYNRESLNNFLRSRNNYYSVCINTNTPLDRLNGGVIFIVSNRLAKQYQNNFKPNNEIKNIKFYSYEQLEKESPQFNEYHNFAPIKNTTPILSCLGGTDFVVLICEEGFNGNHTFPKGKRMLDENSIECGKREFLEETAIELEDKVFTSEYQRNIRHTNALEKLPETRVVYNCFFQIIIQC